MISVILIEPQIEGNIGAIARSMKNFGFSKLILVNPKCKIGTETRNRAKHANDITPKTKKITPKELNPAFKLKPETIKTAIIASIKEIIFER